jgi:hypothetical protein
MLNAQQLLFLLKILHYGDLGYYCEKGTELKFAYQLQELALVDIGIKDGCKHRTERHVFLTSAAINHIKTVLDIEIVYE